MSIGRSLRIVHALGIMAATASLAAAPAPDPFPLRGMYPAVKTISMDEFFKRFGDVVIIDARARLEFNVVRIVGAENIDPGMPKFEEELGRVRAKSDPRPLVFYCNGHTCKKSYEAATRAQTAGFANVLCYDAGIHEWLLAHPDKTILLGESPANPKRLISQEQLDAKTLSFADFKQKARAGGATVIDTREPYYRHLLPVFGDGVKIVNTYGTRLLAALASSGLKDRELLIFDDAGREVQWLQYYLEDHGYQRYWFLRDGVDGADVTKPL